MFDLGDGAHDFHGSDYAAEWFWGEDEAYLDELADFEACASILNQDNLEARSPYSLSPKELCDW
jgi:hypothetical protein